MRRNCFVVFTFDGDLAWFGLDVCTFWVRISHPFTFLLFADKVYITKIGATRMKLQRMPSLTWVYRQKFWSSPYPFTEPASLHGYTEAEQFGLNHLAVKQIRLSVRSGNHIHWLLTQNGYNNCPKCFEEDYDFVQKVICAVCVHGFNEFP